MITNILRGTFYPKFLPRCLIKQFSISGYKVTLLNGGADGGIAMKRQADDKQISVEYNDLQKKFFIEEDYIKFASLNGFKFVKKEDNLLYFVPTPFKP
jgi:hypothetical protein